MASISSGIAMDSNIMNLKEISMREVRPEVPSLMVDSESIIMAFGNGTKLQLDFKSKVDIRIISKMISKYIL